MTYTRTIHRITTLCTDNYKCNNKTCYGCSIEAGELKNLADAIIDIYTVFGAVPPRTTVPGTSNLLEIQEKYQVKHSLTLSTRGIYHSANAGNRETVANCTRSNGRLKPIAMLDPMSNAVPHLDGFMAIAAFPVAQQWKIHHAAFHATLATLARDGIALPLFVETSRVGDLSQLKGILDASSYKGSVIALGVASEGLSEVLALSSSMPNLHLCTNGLHGVGDIDLAVKQMSSQRILFGSASVSFGSLGAAVAIVRMSRISETEKADIMHNNAMNMFGDK